MFERILVLFIVLSFLSFGFALNIRTAGDPSVAYINTFQAKQMGEAVKEKLEREDAVVNDPIVECFIETLGKKLIVHSTSPKDPVHFFVVKASNLNAFTAPGGYVGVDSGIILFVKNEAELAAVMSHETGHVVEKHIPRMYAEEYELSEPTIGAAIASAAIAVFNPAAGLLTLTGSVASYQQHVMNSTRLHERTADRIGMMILYKSGFNPMAMPNLFEALLQNSKLYPSIPAILRNHPTDSYRIADSLNRALQYPKKVYSLHPYFYLIQARIRAELSTNDLETLSIFKQEAESKQQYIKNAAHYGESLIDIKQDKLKQAQIILQQLINSTHLAHLQTLYQLALANMYSKQREYQKAYNILTLLQTANPNNYFINLTYAIAAYESAHYQTAKTILETLEFQHPNNLQVYFYLAEAENKLGDTQTALITDAKLLIHTENLSGAKALLQKALKTKGKNPYARLQIMALLHS